MAARPTLEQQLASAQLRAARIRSQLSENRRREDARRKIVIGGTVLAAMADDEDLRGKVLHLLRENVTRPLDREVVAVLLGEAPPVPSPDVSGDGAEPAPETAPGG